jgi:hypothetical protein
MSTNIISYSAGQRAYVIAEFEKALHDSMLRYSMRHLIQAGVTSQDMFNEALAKSMEICHLAGINIGYHFKQIYVFDMEAGTMDTDWLISKKGFKLILMQYPQINDQLARWIWELTGDL